MEYKAKISYLRITPRKVRLVADLVRGHSVVYAEQQLEFSTKRASQPILKLLRSAVANAKHKNATLNADVLFIKELRVDEGPKLKRFRAASRGRPSPLEKRTSHVSLILSEQKSKTKSRDSKIFKAKNALEPIANSSVKSIN